MQPLRATRALAAALVCSASLTRCNPFDVFAGAGLEPVVISYQGPTDVTLGTTVPFSVTVEADGRPLSGLRLTVTSEDTTKLVVTPGQDSLRGVAIGLGNNRVTLTIQVLNSIFTDTLPTLQVGVRVRP